MSIEPSELLDEIRIIRTEIVDMNHKFDKLDQLVKGEMGVVKEMEKINKQINDFTKDVDVRLSSVEEYITKQKALVAFIAGVFGAIGAALFKLAMFLIK